MINSDCTNLKDLKSRKVSEQGVWSFSDSSIDTTEDGTTSVGVQYQKGASCKSKSIVNNSMLNNYLIINDW